jgi:catechol 2,3-dioxygenase-like lactoylglutathione lyase family enzyme
MFQDNEAFSGFSVDDIDKARAFYKDTLGVKVTEFENMGFSLDLKGTSVFVYSKGKAHTPATFTVLNFKVTDIDKAVANLKAKGIVIEIFDGAHQDDQGIARGKQANMGPDIAWFKDPAGNTLSVLCD